MLVRAARLAILLVLAVAATAAAQLPLPVQPGPAPQSGPEPHPYGANDAGGIRNILPPGSNGTATAAQAASFLSTGARPPHNDDQLGMYDALVQAVPGLRPPDLDRLFKDGGFGVRGDDVESTIRPRADVVIQRDKGFGVPHITGSTREGAMFGIGYATAQDRLFLIDVLRHVGRAQTSSFVGGARGNRSLDRQQWEVAPYTEEDLQRQFDALDDLHGAEGAKIQSDLTEYAKGVNAYIAEQRLNTLLRPAEYAAINRPQGPDDWKPTDTVAIASLVGGIFGKGGGSELDTAVLFQTFEDRFGAKKGKSLFRAFRAAQDPEAEVTITGKPFPYRVPPRRLAKGSLAMPDRDSLTLQPVGPELPPAAARAATASRSTASVLADGLRFPDSMSNALLVAGRESVSGRPLAVFGPQVSYFAPQLLMEQDVHAPGIAARGVSFPGTNTYVQLGRGSDYAWSATAAGNDNVDTFAVELCDPAGGPATKTSPGYRLGTECRPFEVLERRNSWSPSPADQTPPGSETLRAERSAAGIVIARGTVGGRPVAFTRLRSTYRHEVDSGRGFSDFNDPSKIRSAADHARAAAKIGYTFNWFYADGKDISVFQSGDLPVRSPGTSTDFPVDSRFGWKDHDPERNTFAMEPFERHPQVINQSFLSNWNNRVSRGQRAADDDFQYGPVHRGNTLADRIRRGIKGPRKMDLPALTDAMGEGATVDVRGAYVLRWALRVLGTAARSRGRRRDEPPALLAGRRGAPPRPRRQRPVRARPGDRDHGRLVAALDRGAVQAVDGRGALRRAEGEHRHRRDAQRRGRPDDLARQRGLVQLRAQGPAAPARAQGPRRAAADVLRRRQRPPREEGPPGGAAPVPDAAGDHAARGRGGRPGRAVPRQALRHPGRPGVLRRDLLPRVRRRDPAAHRLAEPPDVPADRRDPAALTGRVSTGRRRGPLSRLSAGRSGSRRGPRPTRCAPPGARRSRAG
jgi:acyl-homoserine lactone acylase PvdQ